jgi:hypothetical protein
LIMAVLGLQLEHNRRRGRYFTRSAIPTVRILSLAKEFRINIGACRDTKEDIPTNRISEQGNVRQESLLIGVCSQLPVPYFWR